jgi:hypothetical protein
MYKILHVPNSIGSLVTTIKLKATYRYHRAAMFWFYIVHKNYFNKHNHRLNSWPVFIIVSA